MANNIGSLAVMITGNSSGLSKELKKSEEETRGFARRLASGVGSGVGGVLGGLANAVGSVFEKITSAVTSPIGMLTGLAGGIGLGSLVAESVQLAAEVEDTQASFKVMLGDAEKAKDLFADIRKLAAETPLTSKGLANFATGLVGAGVATEQIIPTLRTLGDLAQGDEERLKGVLNAYLQVRGNRTLKAEELNQFTERQVSLRPALAKVMGVGQESLNDLIERGRVGFPDLQRAIVAMTGEGGRFFGLMEERSKTFNGLLSSLKDNVQMLGAALGKAIIEEFDLKPLMERLGLFAQEGEMNIDRLRPVLRSLKDGAIEFGTIALNVVQNVGTGILTLGDSILAQLREMKSFRNDIEGTLARWAGPLGLAPVIAATQKPRDINAPDDSMAGQFSEAIRKGRERLNMSLDDLKNHVNAKGQELGKALGQGVKQGLQIEMKTLTGEQIKAEQALRDQISPSEVFKRRVQEVRDRNAIQPMGIAGNRAIVNAWNDLTKGIQAAGPQFAGAMAMGSAEAFSARIREQFKNGQPDAVDLKRIFNQLLEGERKRAEADSKMVDLLEKAAILQER